MTSRIQSLASELLNYISGNEQTLDDADLARRDWLVTHKKRDVDAALDLLVRSGLVRRGKQGYLATTKSVPRHGRDSS